MLNNQSVHFFKFYFCTEYSVHVFTWSLDMLWTLHTLLSSSISQCIIVTRDIYAHAHSVTIVDKSKWQSHSKKKKKKKRSDNTMHFPKGKSWTCFWHKGVWKLFSITLFTKSEVCSFQTVIGWHSHCSISVSIFTPLKRWTYVHLTLNPVAPL